MAIVTLNTTPHTAPPYKPQNFSYVVGRSSDGTEFYVSSDAMVRENSIMAVHGDKSRMHKTDSLHSYEIVIPNEDLEVIIEGPDI